MNLKIEGKVAVITGGDSGIGLETAKFLLHEGAKVVLSDIDKDALQKSTDKLLKYAADKENILNVVADLTDNNAVKDLASQVKEKFGGADILVNAAGARGAAGNFLELSDDDWQETIEVDLKAAVRVCRAFIPQMQAKGWGRIVLISSENAIQPYEEESPYNACKAGLINLGKSLSKAYGSQGIMINCVSPAYIATPMTDAMMEELADEKGTSFDEAVQWFVKNKRPGISLQRRGKPEEVAAVIAFLCSELASFVNGSNWRVDGGAVGTAFG